MMRDVGGGLLFAYWGFTQHARECDSPLVMGDRVLNAPADRACDFGSMGRWHLHSHEGIWRQKGGASPSSLAAHLICLERLQLHGKAEQGSRYGLLSA